MSAPFTVVIGAFGAFGAAFGFATMWTALDITEPAKPAAIEVASIEIYDDESTFYDRETPPGKWLAWSGQVFSSDGSELVCRGGGTNQYFNDANPLGTKDVSWLVSNDCAGKITAGQKWLFTWTPIDNDYKQVRYPATGYGVVKSAEEKPNG